MKSAIIDIGSNSVRLAVMADGKTLSKHLTTTRLGDGLSANGKLGLNAITRTAEAVGAFRAQAEAEGIQKIYAFATAAVRSASNGGEFVRAVYELCGLEVDVVSGEQEAGLGLLGALKGSDGGIIDVGGASTEVTVRDGGIIVFSKSVNIGTVRLSNLAGRDRSKLEKIIDEKLQEYGNVDASAYNMYAIGGTASRLGSIKHGLREYHPEISGGTRITLSEMASYADKLLTAPVEEIRATTICADASDIVGGGCLLIYKLMKKFKIEVLTVSESDNLEGYYMLKEGVK